MGTIHLDLNMIVVLIIAALNAYTTYLTSRTRQDIKTVEKATNSMKDSLVEATAKASLAEGTAAGLAAGRAENAANTPTPPNN